MEGPPGPTTLIVDGSSTSVSLTVATSSTSTIESNGDLPINPTTNGFALITGTTAALDVRVRRHLVHQRHEQHRVPADIDHQHVRGTVPSAPRHQPGLGHGDHELGVLQRVERRRVRPVEQLQHVHRLGRHPYAVASSMLQNSSTFTESGGTKSGNPVKVATGAQRWPTPPEAADTDVVGSSTLSGTTVPSGQNSEASNGSGPAWS